MQCRVCGREFDANGFQVVVPGLGQAFDRVECALEASAHGLPPVAAPPVPAVGGPLAPVAATGPAAAGAPAALGGSSVPLVGANLALLAAGTAATIYLWLRVFGADATSVILPAEGAAPAFERSSVPAEIDVRPAGPPRPQPESGARGGGSTPATEPDARAAGAPSGGADGGGGGGPVVVVTPPDAEPRPGSGPSVRPDRPPMPPETRPHEPPKPGKPDKPDRPERRDKPGKPGKPGKPSKPGKPDKPSKPDKPDKPGKGPRHEKDHTIPHGKGKGEKKGHGKHH